MTLFSSVFISLIDKIYDKKYYKPRNKRLPFVK